MGFPILVRWHLYIEFAPWCLMAWKIRPGFKSLFRLRIPVPMVWSTAGVLPLADTRIHCSELGACLLEAKSQNPDSNEQRSRAGTESVTWHHKHRRQFERNQLYEIYKSNFNLLSRCYSQACAWLLTFTAISSVIFSFLTRARFRAYIFHNVRSNYACHSWSGVNNSRTHQRVYISTHLSQK